MGAVTYENHVSRPYRKGAHWTAEAIVKDHSKVLVGDTSKAGNGAGGTDCLGLTDPGQRPSGAMTIWRSRHETELDHASEHL